jgi:hypothetical protein
MAAASAVEHMLHITDEEQRTLLNVLEEDLKELSVEIRRADRIDCRQVLHHEESILQGLVDKLQALGN